MDLKKEAAEITEGAIGEEFKEIARIAPNTAVAPAQGIAAIALSMSMKYHDIATVQDGALYQQYKLEGRNFVPLSLESVFEDAIRIEKHLLGASDRIAKIIVDALEARVEDEPMPDDTVPTLDGSS